MILCQRSQSSQVVSAASKPPTVRTRLRLTTHEWIAKAQYFAKVLKAGNYQTSFYLLGWTPGTFDGHNVLHDIQGCRTDPKSSRGETNLGGYCNPKHDELADKVLVETDKAKRDELMKQAFKIAYDDFAYIPLHQQALAWGVSRKVKLTQRADNSVLLYWARKE